MTKQVVKKGDRMDLTENDLLRTYRKMAEMRVFEQGLTNFYEDGLLVGTGHPFTGEETVAVGACSVVRKEDYTMSTHRPHGHILSKRVPIHIILTKLFRRTTGCTGGSNAIVGAGIDICGGVGLGIKLKKTVTCSPKTDPVIILVDGQERGINGQKSLYAGKIINKLREAEVLMSQRLSIVEASRKIGITE